MKKVCIFNIAKIANLRDRPNPFTTQLYYNQNNNTQLRSQPEQHLDQANNTLSPTMVKNNITNKIYIREGRKKRPT